MHERLIFRPHERNQLVINMLFSTDQFEKNILKVFPTLSDNLFAFVYLTASTNYMLIILIGLGKSKSEENKVV